jgi:hypothetical protein
MKKIFMLAAVAAFASSIVLTSCSAKKDWVCECKLANGTAAGSGIYPNVTKADAQKSCDLMKANSQGLFTCELSEKK